MGYKTHEMAAETGDGERIMTETEYVLVADLRTTRQLVTMLREIIPANNAEVSEAEYRTVMRLLCGWQDRLFKAVPVLTESGS